MNRSDYWYFSGLPYVPKGKEFVNVIIALKNDENDGRRRNAMVRAKFSIGDDGKTPVFGMVYTGDEFYLKDVYAWRYDDLCYPCEDAGRRCER